MRDHDIDLEITKFADPRNFPRSATESSIRDCETWYREDKTVSFIQEVLRNKNIKSKLL